MCEGLDSIPTAKKMKNQLPLYLWVFSLKSPISHKILIECVAFLLLTFFVIGVSALTLMMGKER
jgi:hypothetical protein